MSPTYQYWQSACIFVSQVIWEIGSNICMTYSYLNHIPSLVCCSKFLVYIFLFERFFFLFVLTTLVTYLWSLFRLSEKISLNLTENNPNIADLSDINRPTNLVDKFSTLYDDEWTRAFDELQTIPGYEDDQKAIKQLLDIIMVYTSKHLLNTIQRKFPIIL